MVFLKERIGKLIEVIEGYRYEKKYPIETYKMKRTDGRYEDISKLDTNGWDTLSDRQVWGGHREYFYFDTTFIVPKELEGKSLVYTLRTGHEGEWDALNPQFLVYVNGVKRMGMDVNHRELLLTDNAKAGEEYKIVLQAYTGDNNFHILLDSSVNVFWADVDKYYWDIKVPYDVARLLNAEDDAHIEIIKALNESLNIVDMRIPWSKEFFESIKAADVYLEENFYKKYCGDSKHTVYCTGHTHIDLAWLWTLDTTKDKTVRSFSTVLELMRRYPEYKFMHSQPQEYMYVKENAPEIYEEIKERVREGRWQPEGAMFVEADCNIPSGESLVRQFLYGIRFFDEEFGKKSEMLWLPDVFGYSAALPQIMKLSDVKYFMTTKISWSEFNKMPCDTFYWEGIDGSKILTHFIPARDYNATAKEGSAENEHFTTYNGMLNPSQVMGSWQRYSQKHINDEVLMSYGWGDGGGGPTIEMLENEKRLSRGIPGAPATKQCLPTEFFHVLEENVKDNKYLPLWNGELYLEYHRGTYTSMARNKKYNRKSEYAYLNMEYLAELSSRLFGEKYPAEQLDEGWRTILKNQFHDILPGSAIKEVYDESKDEYENILATSREYISRYAALISDAAEGKAGDIVVINPGANSYVSPVVLPENVDAKALTDGENTFEIQQTDDGAIAVLPGTPSHGLCVYKAASSDGASKGMLDVTASSVETDFFSIKLDDNGRFVSIFDKKADRELLKEGEKANVLMTYEDHPHNFDAWDINNYYTEKSWEIDSADSVEVVENGPVRAAIKVDYTYMNSHITQYLYFYRDLYRFDVRNEIDWHDKNILLRDYFPVDIHSSEATYEIQYGNVKRPTHYNTSWDFAKFEVCAHKWIDLSETSYGLSVINDCKFGYSIHDGVIGLTMLKSAVYPNPEADKEHHSFTYSFCPHDGSLEESDTIAQAYAFNNPCIAAVKEKDGDMLKSGWQFVGTDTDGVIVEAVKKACDSDDIIVRMYEAYNRRETAKLHVSLPVKEAYLTNLLEDEAEKLDVTENTISLKFKPFEIKTVKIKL